MKITLLNANRILLCLTIASMFLMTYGCKDSTENESNSKSINGKKINTEFVSKKPKPPEMDIHMAVISDNIKAIQQHILAGTDINKKESYGGSSPLINAALFDKQDIVVLLLDADADINFQNNDGSTALHVAAFFCRPEIVQLLLDNNADKTIKNNHGSTAYDSVSGPFQDVKPIYDMLGQSLAPMGLNLDYDYIKVTRPKVTALLK